MIGARGQFEGRVRLMDCLSARCTRRGGRMGTGDGACTPQKAGWIAALCRWHLLTVLVACCSVGWSSTASAQPVTAESTQAALDSAQEALDAALRAIAEAEEAARSPPPDWDHLPADRMPLDDYVDQILISVDSGWVMQVDRTPVGGPVVRLHNLDGSLAGRFLLGTRYTGGTAERTTQALVETAFATCADDGQPRVAGLKRDGSGLMYMWSCSDSGRRLNYTYQLDAHGKGIKATFTAHVHNTSQLETVEHHYLPMTDELGFAAATRLNERREEELRQAEANRLQQQRDLAAREARSAERWAVFGAVMQGAVEGMAQSMPEHNQGPRDAYGPVGSFDRAQADMAANIADLQRRAELERAQQSGLQATGSGGGVQPGHDGSAQSFNVRGDSGDGAISSGVTRYTALEGSGTGAWEGAGAGSPSGRASTRDDPSTCVTPPAISAHRCDTLSGYKALVSNSCSTSVDVRVCFMTARGWDCQVNYGVAPGASWEPGWCHASTGETFHSSRYSDSDERLASP